MQKVKARVKQKSKQQIQFPYSMFGTAAVASVAMFFVISSVFAESNIPCRPGSLPSGQVVIDTHSSESALFPNHNTQCNRNNQSIGWLSWFFKQSENAQFHYLDLLELLSRNEK